MLQQYVDCEKNKFECGEACVSTMVLKQQELLQQLLLRSSRTGNDLVKVRIERD